MPVLASDGLGFDLLAGHDLGRDAGFAFGSGDADAPCAIEQRHLEGGVAGDVEHLAGFLDRGPRAHFGCQIAACGLNFNAYGPGIEVDGELFVTAFDGEFTQRATEFHYLEGEILEVFAALHNRIHAGSVDRRFRLEAHGFL